MTTAQIFQLEKYRALGKEIEFYIAEFRLQERNVVIAVGVIWAWLLNDNHPMRPHWDYLGWSIPVIVSGAAAIRSWVLSKHMRTIGGYIESLEQLFGVVGWENFFTAKVRNVKRGSFANVILTYSLLALSIAGLAFHSFLVR